MLRLSRLVSDPELGLEVLVDTGDPEIVWAHVTELADPAPWLTGGEFLLTTGLGLFRDEEGTWEFCRRLAAAEVPALGLSVGTSLPHERFPDSLVRAAEAVGLALVKVPERTPLQSVVRMVSHSLNEEETLPLRRALAAQRRLGHAATRQHGVDEVLGVLYDVSGFSAIVTDPALRIVASRGPHADELLPRFMDDIVARLPQGMRWSLSDIAAGRYSAQVSPLGTQGNLRGILIAAREGSAGADDKALLSMVVSQLSVLLELRYSAGVQNRERRESVVAALIAKHHSDVEAVMRLARAGVECSTVGTVRFSRRLDEVERLIIDAALESTCTDVLYCSDSTGTTALVCDPGDNLPEALTTGIRLLARTTGDGGPVRAGIGTSSGLGTISHGADQARRALGIAGSRGLLVAELSTVEGFRTLLSMGAPAERAAFCADVLEDVEAHALGDGLIDALRCYLQANGNMEQAAGSLGIHRHTLRTRLGLVEQLSGRSLDIADQRFELWLAVELRDLNDGE